MKDDYQLILIQISRLLKKLEQTRTPGPEGLAAAPFVPSDEKETTRRKVPAKAKTGPRNRKLISENYCIEHPDRLVDEWHHVVPRSVGGTYMVPLCNECHGKVHFENWEGRLNHSELIKWGIEKARLNGKIPGRPRTVDKHVAAITKLAKNGVSTREIANYLEIGKSTVQRVLDLNPISLVQESRAD